MPLTAPTGGTVDLIQELIITTPVVNSVVNFSPLNIIADKGYVLQFEIRLNTADFANFPTPIDAIVNLDIVNSVISDRRDDVCTPAVQACVNGGSQQIDGFSTHLIGTYTFRLNVPLNVACGFMQMAQYNGGANINQSGVSNGAWVYNQLTANVTAVGIGFATQPASGIDTGSVFRLYKGLG